MYTQILNMMINDELFHNKNIFKVLLYIWQSIELVNLQYLMIWIVLMITAIIIVFFSRIQKSSNWRINRISTISKDEIARIEDDKKFITALDNVKSKVMINHTKSLRELHAASERCYIKKNASKCIQIVSYCPHLINVKDKKSGMTPFHKVCYHGHVCLVTFMLEKGANPWLTTDAGETALCLAIQACIKYPNRSIVCLESLQQHGCYLDHTNKWYRIYLEAALLTNNKLLARWMFDQASSLGKRCASFPLTRI